MCSLVDLVSRTECHASRKSLCFDLADRSCQFIQDRFRVGETCDVEPITLF